MFAVRVLDPGEDRELAPRTEVDFELADAADRMVVHALGVLPVALAARLPIAFQDVPGVVTERGELRFSWTPTRDERHHRGEHTS